MRCPCCFKDQVKVRVTLAQVVDERVPTVARSLICDYCGFPFGSIEKADVCGIQDYKDRNATKLKELGVLPC